MTEGPTAPAGPPAAGGRPEVTELDVEIVMERRVLILGGAAKSTSFIAANFGGWLLGWTMRESSGSAAAVVKVHNGESVDGQLVAPVALASAGMDSQWLGDRGVDVDAGLYVEIASGQADVVLYMRPAYVNTP